MSVPSAGTSSSVPAGAPPTGTYGGGGDVPTVTQSNVESEIADQLAAKAGQRPDAVRCPGDLPGTLGATMTCTLTASGVQRLVDIDVTSVDGLTVHFDIAVR